MDTERIVVDKQEAERLYRKYKEHQNYSAPIDWEIQRAYQHIAKGRMVIRALASVVAAGVNAEHLPKLAITSATAPACILHRNHNGGCSMNSSDSWRAQKNNYVWPASSFSFPADSFPWNWNNKYRTNQSRHTAQVPLIPVHLRPKRGLQNYHILWEAEWQPIPPRDPMLLRRIGKADLWLCVAQWDLTEVERAALSTRVTR